MHWLDVSGPPGVGKSSICDPIYGPHELEIFDTPPPVDWHDFTNEVTRLLGLVRKHPSFVAAVRMNRRSMRKMATVHEREVSPNCKKPVYIQTGFVQRGLGFGWRLTDMGMPVEELFHFFRLMPVSLGVVFLEADVDELKARNKARESVKATAHENRSHMVELMKPGMDYAKEILDARGVPVKVLNTQLESVEDCRQQVLDFADKGISDPEALGYRGKVPAVSPPSWW